MPSIRILKYLPELLELNDLFTISFYTGNKIYSRNHIEDKQAAKCPEEILKDPASCPRGHVLIKCERTSSWRCDGRHEIKGCECEEKGSQTVREAGYLCHTCNKGCKCDNQTADKARYRCDTCDFDYCKPCYDFKMERGDIIGAHIVILHNEYDDKLKRKVPKIYDSAKGYTSPINCTTCPGGHVLKKCESMSSWQCDANEEPEGCKCDNQTDGKKTRYRCDTCNFDYCEPCYDFKVRGEYTWKGNRLGELFVKRIFRVVPSEYPIGL